MLDLLRRSRRAAAQPKAASPASKLPRIKSERAAHDWHIVGARTEIDHGIYKYPVECSRCGEQREPMADFARFCLIVTYGCARDGFTGRYERFDQLLIDIRHGTKALAWFVDYLPDGRIAATDSVGNSYQEGPGNVKPRLVVPGVLSPS